MPCLTRHLKAYGCVAHYHSRSIVISKRVKNQSPKSIRDSLESEWHSGCTLICAQISSLRCTPLSTIWETKCLPRALPASLSDEFLKRFPFPLSPCALKSHVLKAEEETNNELLLIKTWHAFLEEMNHFWSAKVPFINQFLQELLFL